MKECTPITVLFRLLWPQCCVIVYKLRRMNEFRNIFVNVFTACPFCLIFLQDLSRQNLLTSKHITEIIEKINNHFVRLHGILQIEEKRILSSIKTSAEAEFDEYNYTHAVMDRSKKKIKVSLTQYKHVPRHAQSRRTKLILISFFFHKIS